MVVSAEYNPLVVVRIAHYSAGVDRQRSVVVRIAHNSAGVDHQRPVVRGMSQSRVYLYTALACRPYILVSLCLDGLVCNLYTTLSNITGYYYVYYDHSHTRCYF